MSSLAASRADNFYYPPQYDGVKHGSINKFQGSHPLGDRAKKIHEGILVIRFEMPFKVWCLHCDCIIDQGVRFNAEKKSVGKYFTTPIYHFRMQCKKCSGFIAIQTNPKTALYELVEGLRQKIEEFSSKDAETIELISTEEKERRRNDPMYRLEAVTEETSKVKGEAARIRDLFELQKVVSRDSYTSNSDVRSAFRKRKAEEIKEEKKAKRKKNFAMPLLPLEEEDEEEANETFFEADCAHIKSQVSRAQAEHSSIFPSNSKPLCASKPYRKSCSSTLSSGHHESSSHRRSHPPDTSSTSSSFKRCSSDVGRSTNRLHRLVTRKAELELMRRREGKSFPLRRGMTF
eukprot:GHVS01105730.1.p1 GENE.GHVS01105730.1~~GHVS01105730.1.p1  ORF type:complete len:346 (+),score=72.46 GHVS01105730.1:636-1673(+)